VDFQLLGGVEAVVIEDFLVPGVSFNLDLLVFVRASVLSDKFVK
jgi:hypothetical protein